MADKAIEVTTKGLDPLINNMRQFPVRFKKLQKLGMHASLLVFWENVPPYPAQPAESTYRRTGTLGRTLGSSQTGGKSGGEPDIFKTVGLGSTKAEGRFGTRLGYAPYVIGDEQAKQNAHWWKLADVVGLSEEKIVKVWEGIMNKMTAFLNRRSSGEK